jgi:hypothetical protein
VILLIALPNSNFFLDEFNLWGVRRSGVSGACLRLSAKRLLTAWSGFVVTHWQTFPNPYRTRVSTDNQRLINDLCVKNV